jgi:hypothetical protein
MILRYITLHSYVVMLHNELHNTISWSNYSDQSQSIFYNASTQMLLNPHVGVSTISIGLQEY